MKPIFNVSKVELQSTKLLNLGGRERLAHHLSPKQETHYCH